MSQLEQRVETSPAELGARKEIYQQWRQRLADRQDDLRNFGDHDAEPTESSQWSPDALFKTDVRSTVGVDLAPVEDPRATGGPVPTSATPEDFGSIGDVKHSATADGGWDRTEVEALLRQFRATGGSPRTTSRAARDGSGSGLAGGQSSVGGTPEPAEECGARVVRYFDGSRVVRPSRGERDHKPGSVGEQLRELNRLRLDGEINELEFNRRKRAVFARSSKPPHPSM